jgi:hypothetical protein
MSMANACLTKISPNERARTMTLFGLLFMLFSLAFVWGLAFWCFRKVLTAPKEDHVVKPPDSLGG